MTSTETPTVIDSCDFGAILAFWAADEALIEAPVAYPDCPGGWDDDCEHWTHQPLKDASGRMFQMLLVAVLGEALTDRLNDDLRATYDGIEASLARVGVVERVV